MMASNEAQLKINAAFKTPLSKCPLQSQSLLVKPLNTRISSISPQTSYLHLRCPSALKTTQTTTKFELSASSVNAAVSQEEEDDDDGGGDGNREKLGVVVKPMEKPRVVLKFICEQKIIGIALNQVIPRSNGTIPLTPYYFWPREEAWEKLKVLLESKPWISRNQMSILLNQATAIISLLQDHGDEY